MTRLTVNLRVERTPEGNDVDPAGFLGEARLLIVAGKGGVGKTTVTAVVASAAARAGLRTLIVEVEGKSGIGAVFGRPDPLTYAEVELAPGVRARTLTPDDALVEYLEDHGLRRVARKLASSGALDIIATAVPGIKDLLVLGKVKQLERLSAEGSPYDGGPPIDLIVLDAPAAGHAVTFLTSATGLLDAARVGPIRTQAGDVQQMLTDPGRCRVMLVTLPEETPVNEVVDTARTLVDRVGVALTPLVVNGLYPPVEGLAEDPREAAAAVGVELSEVQARAMAEAAAFRLRRSALQEAQLERLDSELSLPRLDLPFLFTAELGEAELANLVDHLAAEIANLPAGSAPRPSG